MNVHLSLRDRVRSIEFSGDWLVRREVTGEQ